MLTEIATITVLDAQENYLDEAFQRISEDLRRTPPLQRLFADTGT